MELSEIHRINTGKAPKDETKTPAKGEPKKPAKKA